MTRSTLRATVAARSLCTSTTPEMPAHHGLSRCSASAISTASVVAIALLSAALARGPVSVSARRSPARPSVRRARKPAMRRSAPKQYARIGAAEQALLRHRRVEEDRNLQPAPEADPVGRRRDIGQELARRLAARNGAADALHMTGAKMPGIAVEPYPDALTGRDRGGDVFLEIGDDAPLRLVDDTDDRLAGMRISARPQGQIIDKAGHRRGQPGTGEVVLCDRQ